MNVKSSTEEIVKSIQSMQDLEKTYHNKLNTSLINSSITTVHENIYIGPASAKSKTVSLAPNIRFSTINPTAYIQSGSSLEIINKQFEIKINNEKDKQSVTVSVASDDGWSEELYLKGSGHLKDDDTIVNSLTTETSQRELIDKINELSGARIDLFNSLNNMYDNSMRTSVNSRNDLVHQITALKLVEGELHNAKSHIDNLKTDRTNKLRMAELNMYQSDRYDAYVKFLKLILLVAIPSGLIFLLLKINFFTSPESDSGPRLILKDLLIVVMCGILIYGTYRIIMSGYDLSVRNNMNFNSYDFDFNADGGPTLLEYDEEQNKKIKMEFNKDFGMASSGIKSDMSMLKNAGCIGAECCSTGTVYSKSNHSCIPKSKQATISESSSGLK